MTFTALPMPESFYFPLVQELLPVPDPFAALHRLVDLPGVLLFDSSQRDERLGRYSYLMADPFHWSEITTCRYGEDPLPELAQYLSRLAIPPMDGLPPFQGGAAGLLGYESGGVWERIPGREAGPLNVPALAVGCYDCLIAWDHLADRAWILSQGFPEREPGRRHERAASRLRTLNERLAGQTRQSPAWDVDRYRVDRLPDEARPHRHKVEGRGDVLSTFSRETYMAAVQQIIDDIRAGDIFQANLSQQLLVDLSESPMELYARLRQVNPAPFSAYFGGSDWAILSASPERFVQVRDGRVETRPIKGTRPRSNDAGEDRCLQQELLASDKDRAENIMIVDLLRNDLSKVCRAGSVAVPELCVLETYATVHHLVSTVVGELEWGRTAWDLLAASFPGGSITGAPKVRAMEILRSLEPTPRGPYCGCLFQIGFDGSCDSSILIRTMVVKNGLVQIGVGGGVTSASDPQAEYEESIVKARGMLAAFDEMPVRQSPIGIP